jgi:hypothetical protein
LLRVFIINKFLYLEKERLTAKKRGREDTQRRKNYSLPLKFNGSVLMRVLNRKKFQDLEKERLTAKKRGR